MNKKIKLDLKSGENLIKNSENNKKNVLNKNSSLLPQIIVKNARENNLKSISLAIPRYSLVVITGISGSGKSSLAYNTLFNEGQRRYIASLSSYARQFIPSAEPADVDAVEGLSPTISITQKSVSRNPRSTVGTVTRVYDFLRLWFARLGSPFCPNGHGEIASKSKDVVVKNLLEHFKNKTLLIMAPVIIDRKGEYRKEIESYAQQGFSRLLIDGKLFRSEDSISLARYEKHTIEIVCDRLNIVDENYARLVESINRAVDMTGGSFSFLDYQKLCRNEKQKRCKYSDDDTYQIVYVKSVCHVCGVSAPDLEPKLFSFNSPQDACAKCGGVGRVARFDINLLAKNPDKSLYEGASIFFKSNGNVMFLRSGKKQLALLFKKYKISQKTPWKSLPKAFLERLFNGDGSEIDEIDFSVMAMFRRYIDKGMKLLNKYIVYSSCPSCESSGLKKAARNVFYRQYTIDRLASKTIGDLLQYFLQLKKDGIEEVSSLLWKPIYTEIVERLKLLDNIGLGYLSLNRKANTLSGGESQRLRLASQIGSGLEECLYILDEPSIGLHPIDNNKLIETLKMLRDKNNTLVVVEHDEDTILSADHLVEIGPSAGENGGHLLFSGGLHDLVQDLKKGKEFPSTATFDYLLGKKIIDPKNLYLPDENEKKIIAAKLGKQKENDFSFISFFGLRRHNVDGLDLQFPRGKITVISGVSGSGKSTIMGLISQATSFFFACYKKQNEIGDYCKSISGLEGIEIIVHIDQKPIGRTPRSNPATYTKVWDHIRDLFAEMPEAKLRGFGKGRFSFNVKGGRCEECGGAGIIELDMQMFSSVEVLCESCDGRRFKESTLKVEFQGKNIYHVLEMTIEKATDFFIVFPKIHRVLKVLCDVGLGYIRLGQSSLTLSGGEAQRIKLARELAKIQRGTCIYLLDEPTTGLHFEDIKKLLGALKRLSLYGHTIIIVEHNMEVIKSADHIVELGPSSGKDGGQVVFSGTPTALANLKKSSATGMALAEYNVRARKRMSASFQKNPYLLSSEPKQKNKISYKSNSVEVRGLRTNNLKNISLDIPKGRLVVFTGVSGSGKTSLLFDSIFVESQRRYIESLSTYARRFLDQFPRVDVDRMDNLAPAICIDREHFSRNPRSIIATQTELYDRFRLLFANVARPHCPYCTEPIYAYSERDCADDLIKNHSDQKILIAAPIYLKDFSKNVEKSFRFSTFSFICQSRVELVEKMFFLLGEGYQRVVVDGKLIRLDEAKSLQNVFKNAQKVFLVLDRLIVKKDEKSRMVEAVENSYRLSKNIVSIFDAENLELLKYFANFPFCYDHFYGISEAVTPRDFSFNHHQGACSRCDGIGLILTFNGEKLIVNPRSSFLDGALDERFLQFFKQQEIFFSLLIEQAKKINWDIKKDNRPFFQLNKKEKDFLFYGGFLWKGIHWLMDFIFYHPQYAEKKKEWKSLRLEEIGVCGLCRGGRIKEDLQRYSIGEKSIAEVSRMKVDEALNFFKNLNISLSHREKKIAADILEDIVYRLSHMVLLGLNYLNLDRKMYSLSGGERQRIRLCTQLGNKLSGVMYILDEPTVGLHERDTYKLLEVINSLRALDNSVFLVEHCSVMIKKADYIVDVGPKAGEAGGNIVYAGENKSSLLKKTSFYPYLYDEKSIKKDIFSYERKFLQDALSEKHPQMQLQDIYKNNLQGAAVNLPIRRLIGISGVSGSGKSSLVEWIQENFYDCLDFSDDLKNGKKIRKKQRKITFVDADGKHFNPFDRLIVVDQTPISTNSRSILATYMGVYDEIRTVFSQLPLSKQRGYEKGYFSFNTASGVCEECKGLGERQIEMHFISNIVLTCEFCHGKRFAREVLEIFFQGKNIADVLAMSVDQAMDFFFSFARIRNKMLGLVEVGLGYLKLGSPVKILSSGERQRLKIAHQLVFENSQKSLYILDEPTMGLHFSDIQKLISSLDSLLSKGATILVVEHNIEFLKSVDYLVDLGPEGGENGGKILCAGTVDEVKSQMKKEKLGATYLYL